MRRTFFVKSFFAVALIAAGLVPTLFASAAVDTNVVSKISTEIGGDFKLLIELSTILAAIVVAFGGVLYLVSYTRGEVESEGLNWVKSGITGLIIVLAAWGILYMVNPNIFSFTFNDLPSLIINIFEGGGSNSPNPENIINYNEIPLGKLDENLLAGKMNCYQFDAEGNPIAGDQITDDSGKTFRGPTFLNHDRVDCYQQLADAAEKKSQMIENLGKAITQLMSQCSCQQYGNCQASDQNASQDCSNVKHPTGPSDCSPYDTSCKLPVGYQNSNVGLQQDNSLACCPDNIKLQIKGYLNVHGDGKNNNKVAPILLPYTENCTANGNCSDSVLGRYYGLDEFYDPLNGASVSDTIQKTATVSGSTVTYIPLDNCPVCNSSCTCAAGDKNCLQNQPTCQQNQAKCLVNRLQCMQNPSATPWGSLDLYDQLAYLQEQMNQIKNNIQTDQQAVTKAVTQISTCPTIKSYVGLMQTQQANNNPPNTLLNINNAFSTSSTGTDNANSNTYCAGFAYNNSTCYSTCNDQCPITKDSLGCYQSCTQNLQDCSKYNNQYQQCLNTKGKNCNQYYQQYTTCQQQNQTASSGCVAKCYNNRTCSAGSPYKTYGQCMSGCQNNCQASCSLRYLSCSDQYQNCMGQCNTNSQCLQNNIQTCLVSPSGLAGCQTAITNNTLSGTTAINQCIQQASLCPSGSDQYAGYSSCIVNPLTNDKYTSSDLYQNPQTQICPQANAPQNPLTGQSYTDDSGNPTTCVSANPQTAKCSASSKCPSCPCNSVNATLTYSLESTVNPGEPDVCAGDVQGTVPQTTCDTTTTTVKDDYRVVGAECDEPAFSGDPLTFYCQQNWWTGKTDNDLANNLGTSANPDQTLICKPNGEVPVGQTTDDTLSWADDLVTNTLTPITNSVQTMLNFLQQVANAREYCACDSKYNDGNPICQQCCNFTPGENGSISTATCNPSPSCTGDSCQQMMNNLILTVNYHRDIKSNLDDLTTQLTKENRSNILQELTYARNTADAGSTLQNQNGPSNYLMLSCQQVLDNVLKPVTSPSSPLYIDQQALYHYCYGTEAGKVMGDPEIQTDNWFTCETSSESPNSVPQQTEIEYDYSAGGMF
jgi:hypothetical protein